MSDITYVRKGRFVLIQRPGHSDSTIAIGDDEAHAEQCLQVLRDMQARQAACKCEHPGCCGKPVP